MEKKNTLLLITVVLFGFIGGATYYVLDLSQRAEYGSTIFSIGMTGVIVLVISRFMLKRQEQEKSDA